MDDSTFGAFIVAGIFVSCIFIICATTVIHAVLEYKQKRWELERGIKTKQHDYHDDIIL